MNQHELKGVRKILKKYDKIIERYVVDSGSEQYSKLRDDLKSIIPFTSNITPDAHLQQLTNSDSIAAITSSLFRASVKTGSVSVASMEKFLIHDEALLRFKCSIDCIDILREYANVVNEPFPAFLSRQAMIVTGYDLGGIEGMKQRALEVLLTFDPDTILLMEKQDLLEWQQRCWQYTFTTGGYKMRKTTFDMVEDAVGDHSRTSGGRKDGTAMVWGGVNGPSMMINMMSTLLYTVNYYIIAPTANMYAIYLGTNGAFGSTLIGASSFAALFAALLYSLWYNTFSFKSALAFSSLCPLVGNLMYSVALSMKSMKIALIGRILVGFGSAEVVNRQLISACVHFNSMTKASAAFVVAGAAGMSVGPLLAGLLVTFVAPDFEEDFYVPFVGGIAFNHVSSPGFLMAVLWFGQLLAVMFVFSEPDRINSSHVSSSSPEKKKGKSTKQKGAGVGEQSCSSGLREILMLIFRTPALPVTLFLFGYIEMICEVLISSCAMVSKRYFGWDGSVPGYLIASLGALVLPAHFVVERASRTYEERVIMKVSFSCIFIFLTFTDYILCYFRIQLYLLY
jgi:Major Facilitator Superfamily.